MAQRDKPSESPNRGGFRAEHETTDPQRTAAGDMTPWRTPKLERAREVNLDYAANMPTSCG